MRTSFRSFLYRFSVLPLFFFAIPVFAQSIANTAQVHTQICNVFIWMFWVLIAVSVIMILWAGYLYVTARDDAEQTTEAKKAIFYAALGILAALLARGFPSVVAGIFSQTAQGC
jgi:cell division protein FtsW (lipid II flippase)